VPVAQFERVTVDLTGVEDWRSMTAALGIALGQARDGVASEHLVARLRLTGTTPLAWRLRRDMDLLRTEAGRQAEATGKTWIDKLEVECQPPQAVPGTSSLVEADPLDELRRLMGEVADDEAYRAEITDIAEDLRAQLPQECRSIMGTNPEAFAAALDAATRDGIEEVLARLKVASGTGTV